MMVSSVVEADFCNSFVNYRFELNSSVSSLTSSYLARSRSDVCHRRAVMEPGTGGAIDPRSEPLVCYQVIPDPRSLPGPWKHRYIPFSHFTLLQGIQEEVSFYLDNDGWLWHKIPNTLRDENGHLTKTGWWRDDEKFALLSMKPSPSYQRAE